MSMVPQGYAGASCTLLIVPAVAKDAAAATERPVPSTEPPMARVQQQDRLMPVANVSRIMRRALPPHAKISEEAKEAVQDCVSEFISFITGEANERCHKDHRKTLTAEDIVWAMTNLGFEDYVGPLEAFLHRMRDSEGGGGFGGRGSCRGSPLSPYGLPGVYRRPPAPTLQAPPQAYAPRPVPRPVSVPPSSAAPYFAGGELRRSMVPYYGGSAFQVGGSGHRGAFQAGGSGHRGAFQAGGSGHRGAFQAGGSHRGFYTDEAASSSSNGAAAPPAPHAGWRN
ncbi:hypothetical protein HU200_063842 [Digitaria exilis]|uniref:Transcription factor CBF/NF-Y/archaeal histone domain-containing protein n=1 Tax=Digitaria exilis TaxID=1010633 RepID=A0A835AAH9_9POAL|nr:hypothetical protein HU200_063842 [Digitaria exilis]CAB3470320.1 unnamed protein product [Digitaria exilis]